MSGPGDAAGARPEIGDRYQGGFIFWLDATGKHGLLAAPKDLQAAGRSSFPWSLKNSVTGAEGTKVGDGPGNTRMIVHDLGKGSYAANLCLEYSLVHDSVEYNNWYLPSMEELKLMHDNLYRMGEGNFTPEAYWSSSEASDSLAWGVLLYFNDEVTYNKFGNYRIRPVRKF